MARFKEKMFRLLNAAGLAYSQKVMRLFNVDGNYTITPKGIHSSFEGVKFVYDFASLGTTGNIDSTNWSEDDTRRSLFARLRGDEVFYDIGAHGGAYSLTLKTRFPNLRVISFEPQPEELLENFHLNGVSPDDIQRVAVGNAEGEVRMTTGRRSSNHVSQSGDRAVRCVRIEDYAAEKGLPAPDWIKIDIEGMELPALRGMESFLRQSKPTIICEINELFNKFGTTMAEFKAFLDGLGYQVCQSRSNQIIPAPEVTERLYIDHISDDYNYWFVHADKLGTINVLK